MQFFKDLFTPLARISNRYYSILVLFNVAAAITLWQVFAQCGLIPTPLKIVQSMQKVVGTADFIDNLLSSLILTLKGMGYSIVIALVFSYLSLIPFFTPIAKFIIKCRYL